MSTSSAVSDRPELQLSWPSGSSSALLEDEITYLSKRAQQENRLADQTRCARAATAHRYLAAAYASRIAQQLVTPPDITELLVRLP